MADQLKWIASKPNPKRYGDRIQSDVDMTIRVTVNDPFASVPAHVVHQVEKLPGNRGRGPVARGGPSRTDGGGGGMAILHSSSNT